jgi:hypothetical protein
VFNTLCNLCDPDIAFGSSSYAAVDFNDLSPENGSNDILKSSSAAAPFATDFYIRSSSEDEERKVKALLQFVLAVSVQMMSTKQIFT